MLCARSHRSGNAVDSVIVRQRRNRSKRSKSQRKGCLSLGLILGWKYEAHQKKLRNEDRAEPSRICSSGTGTSGFETLTRMKRKLQSDATEPAELVEQMAEPTSEFVSLQPVQADNEEQVNEKGIAAEYDDLGEGDENPAKKMKEEFQEEETEGDEEEFEEEPVEKLIEPFSKEQLAALVREAVERYPDFAESVLRVADADPAHRKIFVHGLGWDTTSETLVNVFGKYGEIEDCKAVIDKNTGKSKGYAFILYKHRSGAKKALMEPQKKIGIRMTSCQLASAGPVPNHAQVHVPTPTAAAVFVPPVPVSEYTQRKIFVSNVAADIDIGKLLEFFRQFGEVEEGPLGLDKQTSKPKGFALFVYKTVEGARKALEEPHKSFEGHILHCQKAIDGPKNSKFQMQQQQHHQPIYNHRKEKQHKYQPQGQVHAPTYGQGHLMAPTQIVGGYNPTVAAQAVMNPALGQALTALIASQGANLGLSNLLGGLGGPSMNQTGTPLLHNAGYVNPASLGFGASQVMQGGYQNPQVGKGGGSRPPSGLHFGGPPYMGR